MLSADPAVVAAADAWLRANDPTKASMLRTSISPNIVQGGYRNNVIPSEARATLDVRMRPGEDAEAFRAQLERLIGDPEVEVVFNGYSPRPAGVPATLDSAAFVAIERAIATHYAAPVIPMMGTGATGHGFLMRAKGMRDATASGPLVDQEMMGRSASARIRDQERNSRGTSSTGFVRFHYDACRCASAPGTATFSRGVGGRRNSSPGLLGATASRR